MVTLAAAQLLEASGLHGRVLRDADALALLLAALWCVFSMPLLHIISMKRHLLLIS